MVTRAYFARRFLALKLLRCALVAGALYDAGLALLLAWRPAAAAAPLGLPVAGASPLAALAAVWLVMLAGLAVAAARRLTPPLAGGLAGAARRRPGRGVVAAAWVTRGRCGCPARWKPPPPPPAA